MNELAHESPCALVVDDDLLIPMETADVLSTAGFRVLEARHGDAAYALLLTRHPDVVLLFTDVQMPGKLDGFALARAVAESWPHVSIVVASGRAKPEPGEMPDKAKFMSKPISAKMVYAHLQEILPDGQKPEPLRMASAGR